MLPAVCLLFLFCFCFYIACCGPFVVSSRLLLSPPRWLHVRCFRPRLMEKKKMRQLIWTKQKNASGDLDFTQQQQKFCDQTAASPSKRIGCFFYPVLSTRLGRLDCLFCCVGLARSFRFWWQHCFYTFLLPYRYIIVFEVN